MLVSFAESLKLEIQSPKLPVISKIPLPRPESLPISFAVPPTTLTIPILTRSRKENRPLNVDLSLADCSSLNLKLLVNFLKPTVNSNNRLAVIGGKTSLNASLTGVITDKRPFQRFFKAPMR